MPVLKIQTNAVIDASDKNKLLKAVSQLAAKELSKPESYVLVQLEDAAAMLFGGSDAPCAFVELFSLGLPKDLAPRLAETLSTLLKQSLQIDPQRVYIRMADHPNHLWGWNGGTF